MTNYTDQILANPIVAGYSTTHLSISGLIENIDQFQEVCGKHKRENSLKCILRRILNG